MIRNVGASLALEAHGDASLAFAISAAEHADEQLVVTQNGSTLAVDEVPDATGTRFHLVDVSAGEVQVEYSARIDGVSAPHPVTRAQELTYLRPSRYCESDRLAPVARAEFAGLRDDQLLDAVSSWVGTRLAYVPGSSLPTDGAVETLLGRRGVCRDYAHLVVALLRALQVPARLAAVYAPGLDPMDFHAVAEAAVDGTWRVVDATTLAPRSSMVRIATGRDASDTAFLNVRGAAITLHDLTVQATVDALPTDDMSMLTALG